MRWDPVQYGKFARERAEPFVHLCQLVHIVPAMRIVDLGCGAGDLTDQLAAAADGSCVDGVDSSPQMIEQTARFARPGLRFVQADLARFGAAGSYDLVFSNAALHWVDGHRELVPRLLELARPAGGQIAWQIPANHDHPAHRLITERLVREQPFERALGGYVRHTPVLPLAEYAELLHACGAREIVALARIYGHELSDVQGVAEWTRGTTLLPYLDRLPEELHAVFLARYRTLLREMLGDAHPYFYGFQRILLHAVRS